MCTGQDESGSDEETENEEGDDDEDKERPVKVKFTKNTRKRSSGYGTRSNSTSLNHENSAEDGSNDSEDDEEQGRGTKRRCASQAAIKIAQVSKRLRSDSKENESSENSNDSNSNSSFSTGGRKRSLDSDGGYDGPKRTRLQRMNTNRCGDSGDLDNVLLDRLLVDLMKHGDAWPFLKPVTRSEVSYLFISAILPLCSFVSLVFTLLIPITLAIMFYRRQITMIS